MLAPIALKNALTRVLVVLLVASSACLASAEEMSEGNAWEWGSFASDAAATWVEDDSTRVKVGQQSIKFITESGFDTGVLYPDSADAGWNLVDMSHLVFWTYAINNSPYGFQGNQPIVVLNSCNGGTYRYEPQGTEMFNRSWHLYHVPLDGDEFWVRSESGNPSMDCIDQIEIHQDTWDYGFTIFYDGVEFITMEPGGTPPAGPPPPAGVDPDRIPARVLLFVFDPIMQNKGGQRRQVAYGWGDPESLTADVVADLNTHSHGRVQYEVVETITVDDFPIMKDGFQYDDAGYDEAWSSGIWHEEGFDYARFIADANLAARVESGEIDEVFLYGAPGDGFWESTMAGDGAYWCNSSPVEGVPSERAFVLMGWNYERGVAEALHSWGHRSESIMDHSYGTREPNRNNNWSAFSLQERQAPGQGSIGDVHFPVNGESDYDYDNPSPASSDCDNWYNYPDLSGSRRDVNSSEWSPSGIDPHRDYMNWRYDHMPHMSSKGDDQYLANWWRYLVDVEQFKGWDGNLYYSSGYGNAVITTPEEGAEVGGEVIVKVRASMDGALGRVDLYVDGVYHSSDFLAPFVFLWDTHALTGLHALDAYVYELQNGTESFSELIEVTVVGMAPVPSEVSPPGAEEPLRFTDATSLTWEPAANSGAEWFNLYRGYAGWLADGAGASCLKADLTTNQASDPESPWPGAAWYYLVTGESSGGEGTRGTGSNAAPRPNTPACF